MAQQIGSGKQLARAKPKPKRQFVREATAAAEATREILSVRFRDQPWVEQVLDGVRNAVQNGIDLFSGTSISSNAHPQDNYRFPARTKEELLATQHLVAGSRDVGRTEEPEDPAAELEKPPEAKPRPASPKANQGWIV